jgi:lipopolysaccharide/colanic/teichoic acid biosynthesis glycosyltransferase
LATHINPALADLPPDVPTEPALPPTPRLWRERLPVVPSTIQPIRHRWYLRCKFVADILLALVLAIPTTIVVLLAALVVKLTSKGPAFYTQKRVGKDGRIFTIVKLRTMIHDCESITGPRWSLPGDPRVTPVGWVLRATHLDELPQLLNVLRGEMSLIGPRPERPEFVPQLERVLPSYRQRLNVRPGITGLAQVLLPADSDVESVRKKLTHDLYYIRHLGPWLDMRLMICTGLYALAIPFRITSKLLGLPTSAKIEKRMGDVVPDAQPSRMRLSA